eukprot:TRINITY_DN184_c0_g1_i4.p1 TRINITY_DN184_c0_g1~~TRINITY_DN184_c0_g1_i4.p1  ORF type:complete len:128 (+),score=16.22 TRINITY_DN184_c0_g1_i4:350-733(+)
MKRRDPASSPPSSSGSIWNKTTTWAIIVAAILLVNWMVFFYISMSYKHVVHTLEREQSAYRLKAQKYRLLQDKYKALNSSYVSLVSDHNEYMEEVSRVRSNLKYFKQNAAVETVRRTRLEKSNSVLE